MANQIVQFTDSSSNNLYPKEAVIDISSSITYNLTFGTGYAKAYYYPSTGTVRGAVTVYNGTTSTFGAGDSGAPFTIASAYRPSSNISGFPIMVKNTSSEWHGIQGTVSANGKIGQNLTSTAKEMYMAFEYTI